MPVDGEIAKLATWLDPEERAYPHGAERRRGRAILRRNPCNPMDLPYGTLRAVHAGIPDTYSTIPAYITVRGRRVRGYLFRDDHVLYWSPNPDEAFTATKTKEQIRELLDREHVERNRV